MFTAFVKSARILSREGMSGVIGRLCHTPLRSWFAKPSVPPRMGTSIELVDHGNSALAARLATILQGAGITLARTAAERPADDAPFITRWHIGAPERARPQDLVLIVNEADAAKGGAAGMLLDHDPMRLEALSRCSSGRLHYLAVPSPDASDDDWRAAILRALIFLRALPLDTADYRDAITGADPGLPSLCLSLPEFPERMAAFTGSRLATTIRTVSGVRFMPGWIGAGASYRALARGALDLAASRGQRAELLVCQDDAEASPDHERNMVIIRDYWRMSGADIFSGLITDVDDSFRVTRVVRHEGLVFVHLNRNIGLVFNLFGRRALERLATWVPPENGGRLTIDRYLGEAEELDVVVTLPYLIGHRGGVMSSIWGFRNDRYDTLIRYSENRLMEMAEAFERR